MFKRYNFSILIAVLILFSSFISCENGVTAVQVTKKENVNLNEYSDDDSKLLPKADKQINDAEYINDIDTFHDDDNEIPPEMCERSDHRSFVCDRDRLPEWHNVENVGDFYSKRCYEEFPFDKEFIDERQRFVGILKLDNEKRGCSGFLIAPDLFVTAAHCINYVTNSGNVPTGLNVIGANFSYQYTGGNSGVRSETYYPLLTENHKGWGAAWDLDEMEDFGLVEWGWWLNPENPSADFTYAADYAILRLGKSEKTGKLPGNDTNTFDGQQRGWATPSIAELTKPEKIVVIGHPRGIPKKVDAGLFDEYSYGKAFRSDTAVERLLIKDIDLEVGNSGSPLFNESGTVSGVVVWSECFNEPGKNSDIRHITTSMIEICKVSQIIKTITGDYDCNAIPD